MDDRIKVAIEEEYGYRQWVAHLTPDEYADLVRRWRTMRGLNCLVPVQLIVPQAVLAFDFADINIYELQGQGAKRCHVHECDDSFLADVVYDIPAAHLFTMDGKVYSEDELDELNERCRAYCSAAYAAREAQSKGKDPAVTPY